MPQPPTQPPEAAASDDTEAAKFCDNPPWTRADLVEIERQLEQLRPEEIFPVPNKVDELRSSFERHGCASRPSAAAWEWGMFDSIWQRTMEKAAKTERLTARASLEKEERTVRANFDQNFARAKEAARSEAAHKKGFVEVRSGFSKFLEEVRDTGLPLSEVRKRLVMLTRDDDFKVLQVLGSTGLFINDELRVFVDAGADGLYEGTPLSAVGTQFQVTGTRSYTALVGVRQAFVLKPVAELDLGRAPLLSLLPSYEQDGFVTMGEYLDGDLGGMRRLPIPSLSAARRRSFRLAEFRHEPPRQARDTVADGLLPSPLFTRANRDLHFTQGSAIQSLSEALGLPRARRGVLPEKQRQVVGVGCWGPMSSTIPRRTPDDHAEQQLLDLFKRVKSSLAACPWSLDRLRRR